MAARPSAPRRQLLPSITSWTRLEPSPRDASLQKSLQAQVRDPVWMLARQWQVGEFLGDDAGSPVHATLGAEMQTVTTYRPGVDDAATVVIDPTLPIEVHVERETVVLRLRGSVQHGLYFEKLVRQGGVTGPEAVIAAFRAAFPIPAAVPDPKYATADAARFRSLVAGRVTDGEAFYASASAVAAGQTPAIPLPPEAGNVGMPAVIAGLPRLPRRPVQPALGGFSLGAAKSRLRFRPGLADAGPEHPVERAGPSPAVIWTGTRSPSSPLSQTRSPTPTRRR